ncbi:hypothetical protein V2J09_006501 [Rumex salicifolius]
MTALLLLLVDLEEVIPEVVLLLVLVVDMVVEHFSVIIVRSLDTLLIVVGVFMVIRQPEKAFLILVRKLPLLSSSPNVSSPSVVNPPLISQEHYNKSMSLLSQVNEDPPDSCAFLAGKSFCFLVNGLSSSWILDSGATNHITPYFSYLLNIVAQLLDIYTYFLLYSRPFDEEPQLIGKEIKGLYVIDMNLCMQDVNCHALSSFSKPISSFTKSLEL